MSLFVIDASVAAKWILPPKHEPLAEQAVHLLERYGEGKIRFVVPDLFWAELANLLWKAVRTGRCTRDLAEAGLALMKARGLPTVPSLKVLEPAFAIASVFGRTVYDSIYIALAVDSAAQLITADQRLANAVAAHLPVKSLASV